MSFTEISANVVILSEQDLNEAVDVLVYAFEHYPLMCYLFADRGASYYHTLEQLFYLFCRRRLISEGVLLGSLDGAKLVGIAAITDPSPCSPRADLELAHEQFITSIGDRAAGLFEEYHQLTRQHRPLFPHLHLGMLGIYRGARRRGHARSLLSAVHLLSEAHPTSQGIYLDTEHPANVSLYQHFGYQVIAEEHLGPVTIWCMFRPNEAYR